MKCSVDIMDPLSKERITMIADSKVFKTMIPASSELRDDIAMAALPALVGSHGHNVWEMARKAYQRADAMLTVREEHITPS